MEKFKNIRVGFYFDNEPTSEVAERLQMARELFTKEGGCCTEEWEVDLIDGLTSVVFLALIPESQYLKHHGFDSKLNKAYPDGCGAGYVGDAI